MRSLNIKTIYPEPYLERIIRLREEGKITKYRYYKLRNKWFELLENAQC